MVFPASPTLRSIRRGRSSKTPTGRRMELCRQVPPSRRTEAALRLRGELAADLGERALLGLVEDGERAADALGVLGEQAVDDLAAAVGQRDARGAAGARQAPAGRAPPGLRRGGRPRPVSPPR